MTLIERLADAGYHGPEDFEDIPPIDPTAVSLAASASFTGVGTLLRQYGYTITLEDGWETRNPTYHWYEDRPLGIMVHHTGTTSYAPERAYPLPEGTRDDGTTICNVLVQPDGVLNMISTDPANYSSGLNWKGILDDFVSQGIRFDGPQSGDLGPEWYGNRAWINIETVHPGDGSPMPAVQEQALIGLLVATCYIYGWDSTAVIGHYDGRGSKIDPKWDGPYGIPPYSIAGIQDRVQTVLDSGEIPSPVSGGSEVFYDYAMGWFDTLQDGEIELMSDYGLFEGGPEYWIMLKGLGVAGRNAGQNDEVLHFYHSVELEGWARPKP